MIAQLFQSINQMMGSGLLLTFLGSFVWGLLSVALSPCHLTSIPLIIGFVEGAETKKSSGRFLLSLLFALGITLSIAIIGILTASAGRIAGDMGNWTNWLAAAIFALIGFNFLDIIQFNPGGLSTVPIKKKGKVSAFLIGLLFGVALGPCTFAFMAPILAVTFTNSTSTLFPRAMILTAYGVGHSLLIVLAGTYTGMLQKYLKWSGETGHSQKIKKASGVLLLLGSLYFLAK